jgi:tetrahydromethanopterin S-methyltransferase subunit F
MLVAGLDVWRVAGMAALFVLCTVHMCYLELLDTNGPS